ncbi:MAG: RT0821/Lpp0805 family surface protein, partial [Alphaproteobacteria bacterium]
MPAGRERGRKRALKTAALVALVGLALAACAYGDAYAPERTPPAFAALDAADRAVQAQAFQHALENNKVGEGANWSNPESGHLGTVTPTRTYEAKSGAPCRAYQQTVTVAGETAIAHGTACRQADGTWKLAAAAGAGYRRAYAYPRYAYGYPYYAYGYPYYG